MGYPEGSGQKPQNERLLHTWASDKNMGRMGGICIRQREHSKPASDEVRMGFRARHVQPGRPEA